MALTGSSEVMVGETAVFELKVTMKDAANVFIVDAFAPINRTNIMSVCSVRLKRHGKLLFQFYYSTKTLKRTLANFYYTV